MKEYETNIDRVFTKEISQKEIHDLKIELTEKIDKRLGEFQEICKNDILKQEENINNLKSILYDIKKSFEKLK